MDLCVVFKPLVQGNKDPSFIFLRESALVGVCKLLPNVREA